ncbi:MAG: DUF2339 domain-containing protein [Planctomycetota bacterium]
MILGALIVVAGAGFFLKLAYDAEWHKLLSPAWRCGFAALFGALLMGAGELARRKLGAFAAIGFSAAGIGVLYATAYATSGVFGIVPVLVSFWMLAGVCVLGLLTGLRAKSRLLAALALVGGYLSPVIMGDPDSALWALPAYLLALLVIGSGVSAARPGQRVLATIAWWGTSAMGTLWMLLNTEEAPVVSIVFVALAWAIAQETQHAFTSKRHLNTLWRDLPVLATTGVTLWAGAGLLFAAFYAGAVEQWAAILALAIACLAQGINLGRGLRFFASRLQSVRERTAIALVAQGASLLPLVVYLAFDAPWAQSLVWASMAIASVAAAWRTRMPALLGYACALLSIASARVIAAGIMSIEILAADAGFPGLVWTPWMAMVGTIGLVWCAASACAHALRDVKGMSEPLVARRVLAAVGGVHLVVMLLHESPTAAGVASGLIVLALVALGAHTRRALRPEAGVGATALAALALPAWLFAYLGSDWGLTGQPPVLTNALLWSALLALALALTARYVRIGTGAVRTPMMVGSAIAAGGVLLVSTSIEAWRLADAVFTDTTAQAAALSLWWAIIGVASIVAGVLKRVPGLRYGGLAMLLVAMTKVLTYDLATLSPAARVASFIAVGLVLLIVATGYLRATKRASDAAQAEAMEDNGQDGAGAGDGLVED